MVKKFSRCNTADYLQKEQYTAPYLEACLEDGDTSLIVAALGNPPARAAWRNWRAIRESAGRAFTKQCPQKAISVNWSPTLMSPSAQTRS